MLLPVTFLLLSLAAPVSATCRDGKCSGVDDGDADVLLQSRVKVAAMGPGTVQLTQAEEEVHKRLAARKPLLIEQDLSALHESNYAKLNRQGKSAYDALMEAFEQALQDTGIFQELTPEEKANFAARFEEDAEMLLKHAGISQAQLEQPDTIDDDLFHRVVSKALEEEKPLCTEQYAESINSAQHSFTISCGQWKNSSKKDGQSICGKKPETEPSLLEYTTPGYQHMFDTTATPPSELDGRTHFSQCADVVGRIHNQGTCGSCWVFGALSSLDSRLCIKTGGAFSGENAMLSRGYTTSCASSSGCSGGLSRIAYELYRSNGGGVTGGDNGCSPYFGHGNPEDHFDSNAGAPPCPTQCGNSGYHRDLNSDKFNMPSLEYSEVFRGASDFQITLQRALSQDGPVPFGIYVGSAFFAYNSGVFTDDCSAGANHEVVAIGYGTSPEEHVIGLNSWGSGWGDSGSFKVAYCMVTDFTLTSFSPEDTSSFPNPLFAGGSPTPTPSPSLQPTDAPCEGPWCVTSGPCTMEQGTGCIMSPNWDGGSAKYDSEQACDISVVAGASGSGPEMEVVDFNVETNYDKLMVNGVEFNPDNAGDSVVPAGSMTWSSDFSINKQGWKICPRATPAPATAAPATAAPVTAAPATAPPATPAPYQPPTELPPTDAPAASVPLTKETLKSALDAIADDQEKLQEVVNVVANQNRTLPNFPKHNFK